MRVIGTAGHVDHGKSTLVQALTGTHPDRLKEEQEREMTIDLGFAWLTLSNGEEVGIIDVPGHRDFIENMLAGIGGIDATVFVIAADEGVMPQTREHLAILDLLQIQGGVVALTKIDLVDGDEWMDLVEDDVRLTLQDTVLEEAQIVRVSARTRVGINELLSAIEECLAERPPRPDLGKPRLPIDRVFTIAGFGTVVTGTLSDGSLQVGDDLEIMPHGLRGRVRGLQTHKKKEEMASPGSRTAVNITGVSVDQLQRGDVLAHPRDYKVTRRMDVHFRLLPDVTQPLKHNTEVKLFIGAAEVLARVRLLGSEALNPGEAGWLQLEMSQPVVAVRGDRYILRRPSPGETLGGGIVVDPHPKGRHKRFSSETIKRLTTVAKGTPSEVLYQAVIGLGAAPLREIVSRSNLSNEVAEQALVELYESGQIIPLENQLPDRLLAQGEKLVTSKVHWEQLTSKTSQEIARYHKISPLKKGMPREELKSRLKLNARLYNVLLTRLVEAGELEELGPLLRMPAHEIRFNPQQQAGVSGLLEKFKAAPYSPPSVKECTSEVGEDVYLALIDLGQLVPVSAEVVFSQEGYAGLLAGVRELIAQHGTVSAAMVRDHFDTSRRYILAFLEHLDAIGTTQREGDVRRLKK